MSLFEMREMRELDEGIMLARSASLSQSHHFRIQAMREQGAQRAMKAYPRNSDMASESRYARVHIERCEVSSGAPHYGAGI